MGDPKGLRWWSPETGTSFLHPSRPLYLLPFFFLPARLNPLFCKFYGRVVILSRVARVFVANQIDLGSGRTVDDAKPKGAAATTIESPTAHCSAHCTVCGLHTTVVSDRRRALHPSDPRKTRSVHFGLVGWLSWLSQSMARDPGSYFPLSVLGCVRSVPVTSEGLAAAPAPLPPPPYLVGAEGSAANPVTHHHQTTSTTQRQTPPPPWPHSPDSVS